MAAQRNSKRRVPGIDELFTALLLEHVGRIRFDGGIRVDLEDKGDSP